MPSLAITGMLHQPKARFTQALIELLSDETDAGKRLMNPGPAKKHIARAVDLASLYENDS